MIKLIHDYVALIKSNVDAGDILSINEIESKIQLFGRVVNILSI